MPYRPGCNNTFYFNPHACMHAMMLSFPIQFNIRMMDASVIVHDTCTHLLLYHKPNIHTTLPIPRLCSNLLFKLSRQTLCVWLWRYLFRSGWGKMEEGDVTWLLNLCEIDHAYTYTCVQLCVCSYMVWKNISYCRSSSLWSPMIRRWVGDEQLVLE